MIVIYGNSARGNVCHFNDGLKMKIVLIIDLLITIKIILIQIQG